MRSSRFFPAPRERRTSRCQQHPGPGIRTRCKIFCRRNPLQSRSLGKCVHTPAARFGATFRPPLFFRDHDQPPALQGGCRKCRIFRGFGDPPRVGGTPKPSGIGSPQIGVLRQPGKTGGPHSLKAGQGTRLHSTRPSVSGSPDQWPFAGGLYLENNHDGTHQPAN